MAFVSLGSFVPDETWQSVEIAHKMVFGHGYLTWEWQKGLRSYLHPCLYAVLFYIMKWTALDTPDLIVVFPRMLQGVLSAIGDTCIVKMFDKVFDEKKKTLFIIIYSSNWFMLYASSRTLINTFETALTNIALRVANPKKN